MPGVGSVELSTLNAAISNAVKGTNAQDDINIVLRENMSKIVCKDGSMHVITTPGALTSGLKVNQGNSTDNALGANQIQIIVNGALVNLKENGAGKCMLHPHVDVDLGGGNRKRCE